MADDITLTVQARDGRGRGIVRKLRAEGLLPGVIYGPGIEPQALSVPRAELLKVLHAHGAHPLVTVKVDGGEEYLALVKDLQVDPVRQLALHVDFHRVRADKPVQTEVEVRVTGDAPGVKSGGILDVTLRLVAIEALPRALPEAIELDVSDMELGDVKRVSDLAVPDGVTVLTDAEESVASVVAPRVEEPELTPEEAEALGALSAEELEALKELAATATEEGAPEAEGGEGEGAEGGEAAEGSSEDA